MCTTKTSRGTLPKLEVLANYWDCHNTNEEEGIKVRTSDLKQKVQGLIITNKSMCSCNGCGSNSNIKPLIDFVTPDHPLFTPRYYIKVLSKSPQLCKFVKLKYFPFENLPPQPTPFPNFFSFSKQ